MWSYHWRLGRLQLRRRRVQVPISCPRTSRRLLPRVRHDACVRLYRGRYWHESPLATSLLHRSRRAPVAARVDRIRDGVRDERNTHFLFVRWGREVSVLSPLRRSPRNRVGDEPWMPPHDRSHLERPVDSASANSITARKFGITKSTDDNTRTTNNRRFKRENRSHARRASTLCDLLAPDGRKSDRAALLEQYSLRTLYGVRRPKSSD